jgi:tRNA dimethylallyltransferase
VIFAGNDGGWLNNTPPQIISPSQPYLYPIKSTKPHIIAIGGPTASGKTAAAIAMAQKIDAEIISADSRQFYRGMDIGTAKPRAEELSAVPHHCIDICAVTEHFNAGDFERIAIEKIAEITARGKRVIVTGGSGLYLQALLYGLHDFPDIDEKAKAEVEEIFAEGGILALQNRLQVLDPVCFARVDKQNPMRLRRALEVCIGTGKPYSSFLETQKPLERPFEVTEYLVNKPRAELYERINLRVDTMLAAGLEVEVRGLLPYRHLPVLQTIGYEEWYPYFDGLTTYDEVVDKIKQHSRNYAKRQLTWFKEYGNWC